MSSTDWVIIGVVVVLVFVAGFLAMAETSLTRMNRIRAMALEEEGRKRAHTLTRLVEHPEQFLNPVLLLVLICHLVAATLVGTVADKFGGGVVALAAAVEAVVIFVFAEAAPKTYAVQHADSAALRTAPVVALITKFWPLRMIAQGLIRFTNWILPGKGLQQGPFVSEEDLLAMADAAEEDEVIEREERALIHSIIQFGDTVAREVMVPRPDVLAVDARDRIGDVIEMALAAGYSRIPVYEMNVDDMLGIAFTKDLVRAEREGRADDEVRTIVRDGFFVPETKRAAELMREMQKRRLHMAIVLDEYGGTAGIVTLEDLIEELVGEIIDEYDQDEPDHESLGDGEYRINAKMAIDELGELLETDLPEGDWDTVGGLILGALGHVPEEGESVNVDGHRFVAEKVQGRRIIRVRVSRREPEEPEGGPAPDIDEA